MAQKLLTGVDLNNQRAVNVADPSSATDAATKQYVDAKVAGLSWKDEVRAASTGNITLASGAANGSVLDGVALVTGDRILLKDQTTAADNGIYTVNATGAPTRATDADAIAELENATVFVSNGTVNADRAYTQTATITTVGTTSQTWVQFGAGSGTTYTGTAPIVVTGSVISLDTSVVPRKVSFNCAATTNPQTFNHALATLDIQVEVWEVSTGKKMLTDVSKTDTNNISVDFGAGPTASQYRIVVIG